MYYKNIDCLERKETDRTYLKLQFKFNHLSEDFNLLTTGN